MSKNKNALHEIERFTGTIWQDYGKEGAAEGAQTIAAHPIVSLGHVQSRRKDCCCYLWITKGKMITDCSSLAFWTFIW